MEYLQPFLREDAKPDTQPMTHYVEDPVGIEKQFGDVSYAKGEVISLMQLTLKNQLNIKC